MALLASSVSLSTPILKIQVNQFKTRPSSKLHAHGLLQLNRNANRPVSKTTMAQFGDPNKMKPQLAMNFIEVKDKLWETTPQTVKDFPWTKAENLLLEKLLIVGRKALNLSLVAVFVLSCLSDVVYSISTNQELMIPFGLLLGCLMTDFLNETTTTTTTSQLAFRSFQGLVLKWQLLAIGCFFVLVKFASAFFALRTQVFFLHVANGGLMQVLWLWSRRSQPQPQPQQQEEQE